MGRRRLRWGALVSVVVALAALAPSAPASAAPAITVTPATALLDKHVVQVEVTGLTPGTGVLLAQCGPTDGTCATAAYARDGLAAPVTVDHTGTAGARMQLWRVAPYSPGAFDCTGGGCRVVAIGAGGDVLAAAPVTFAPTGTYQWAPADLTVTPVVSHRAELGLTLHATGLNPWRSTGVSQPSAAIDVCRDVPDPGPTDCRPGVGYDATLPRYFVADVDTDGEAHRTVSLERYQGPDVGPWFDCAVVGCTVALTQGGNPDTDRVPLVFPPEWKPWATVDDFLTDAIEAVGGRTLAPSVRAELAAALADRSLLAVDLLAQAAIGSSPTHPVAEVVRLYRAFFDRAVEAGGLGYWVGRLEAGASVSSIGRAFGGTAEFRAQYDGLSDGAVVDKVYRSTLGREADAAGRAYWVARLGAGLARSTLVVHFARSAELRSRTALAVQRTLLTWGLLGEVPGSWASTRSPRDVAVVIMRDDDLHDHLHG